MASLDRKKKSVRNSPNGFVYQAMDGCFLKVSLKFDLVLIGTRKGLVHVKVKASNLKMVAVIAREHVWTENV